LSESGAGRDDVPAPPVREVYIASRSAEHPARRI